MGPSASNGTISLYWDHQLLPAFLSFLFLNTDTMTSRFPITSTTMVVIRTPASRVTAQGKDCCCWPGAPSPPTAGGVARPQGPPHQGGLMVLQGHQLREVPRVHEAQRVAEARSIQHYARRSDCYRGSVSSGPGPGHHVTSPARNGKTHGEPFEHQRVPRGFPTRVEHGSTSDSSSSLSFSSSSLSFTDSSHSSGT
ncbi:unnamed protein product [Pleuronectes platessa]|uniref:Uncharacterized protein n=1 Tax=Pleuronectes platessa TaxID=8262 RepID=A0A9N7TRH4_PLEPL|nr:unnamed protein product [Pleuronectes platessa]